MRIPNPLPRVIPQPVPAWWPLVRTAGATITGTPIVGETLTSTRAGQWYLNDEPIPGEESATLIIPESAVVGDEIRQDNSNTITVGFAGALYWGGSLTAWETSNLEWAVA